MRFLLLLLILPWPAAALSPADKLEVTGIVREVLRTDPGLLRDALRALEVDDARQQLAATQDALAIIGPRLIDPRDPVAGNPLGDVTIVNFYDTRCPYCRQMLPTEAELLRQDPGVRLVHKDLPVLGQTSQLEARALLAAQKQGGYFKLQASIMRTAAPSTRDTLRAEADRLGLDGPRLMRDLDDPVIKERLAVTIAMADQLGLQGTPALVVGNRLLSGAQTIETLQAAVAQARAARK